MGTIPATQTKSAPVIAWIAHVDTSETSGCNVKPIVHGDYAGNDLVLPGDPSKVIRVADNPELTLVGRGLAEDDAVLVEPVLGQRRDAVGAGEGGGQRGERQRAGQRMRADAAQLVRETATAPRPPPPRSSGRTAARCGSARAAAPAAAGRRPTPPARRGSRRSAPATPGPCSAHVALEDAHHQRDLQADQHADHQHQPIQQQRGRRRGT